MELCSYSFADWWKSMRPFSLVSSALPALFGTILAGTRGIQINWAVATVSVVTSVLLHLIANLTNSLYDWLSGHDRPGSPQIVPLLENATEGIDAIEHALRILYLITSAAIVTFGALTSWVLMIYPVLGWIGGVYYTKPPIAYKHRGWGTAGVILLMGLAAPAAAFQGQTGWIDIPTILACVPMAALVTAIMLANEIRDREIDQALGSITSVVLLGPTKGKHLYMGCLLIAYGAVIFNVTKGFLPSACLLVLCSLPHLRRLYKHLALDKLTNLDKATAQFYGSFCILYLLTLIWAN